MHYRSVLASFFLASAVVAAPVPTSTSTVGPNILSGLGDYTEPISDIGNDPSSFSETYKNLGLSDIDNSATKVVEGYEGDLSADGSGDAAGNGNKDNGNGNASGDNLGNMVAGASDSAGDGNAAGNGDAAGNGNKDNGNGNTFDLFNPSASSSDTGNDNGVTGNTAGNGNGNGNTGNNVLSPFSGNKGDSTCNNDPDQNGLINLDISPCIIL